MKSVQKLLRSPCATMTDVAFRSGLATDSETRKTDSPLKLPGLRREQSGKTETPPKNRFDGMETSNQIFSHQCLRGTRSKVPVESLTAQLALPLDDATPPLLRTQSSKEAFRASSCPLDGEPISLLTQQLKALEQSQTSNKKRSIQTQKSKTTVNLQDLPFHSPPSDQTTINEKQFSTPKGTLRKKESQTDPRGIRPKKYFVPRSHAVPTPPRSRACTTRRCQCPQVTDFPGPALLDSEKNTSFCVNQKMNSSRMLFNKFSTSADEVPSDKMKNISLSDDDNFVQLEQLSRRKLTFSEFGGKSSQSDFSESPRTPPQLQIGGKPFKPCPLVESSSGTPPIQRYALRRKSHSPSSRASPLSPHVKLPTFDSPSPTPMVGLGRLARAKTDLYSPIIVDSKKIDTGLRRTTTSRQLIASGKTSWGDSDSLSSCSEDEGDEFSDQEFELISRRKKRPSFDKGSKNDDEENFCQFLVEL